MERCHRGVVRPHRAKVNVSLPASTLLAEIEMQPPKYIGPFSRHFLAVFSFSRVGRRGPPHPQSGRRRLTGATVLAARGGRRSAHTSTEVSRYVVFRFSIESNYYYVSSTTTSVIKLLSWVLWGEMPVSVTFSKD